MRDAFAILFICICFFAAGFGVAHLLPRKIEESVGGIFQLSDNAIARIAHEAYRAYSNSIGVLKVKGWAGLAEAERQSLAMRVKLLRENVQMVPAEAASLKTHILHAIVRLFEPRKG
jgi:hypothetical protein